MSKTIFCQKLQAEHEQLDRPPYPGAIGQRIFEHISKEAWNQWLAHQTMLINEYRLSVVDPASKKFLMEEMEKFLFAGGADKPAGFSEK